MHLGEVLFTDVVLQVVQPKSEQKQGRAAPQKRGEHISLTVSTVKFT